MNQIVSALSLLDIYLAALQHFAYKNELSSLLRDDNHKDIILVCCLLGMSGGGGGCTLIP